MNNLLTRELPLHCTIRLWDTYLAESDGFAIFHLYVCAAFLLHWKDELMQQNDFQVNHELGGLKTLCYLFSLLSLCCVALLKFSC